MALQDLTRYLEFILYTYKFRFRYLIVFATNKKCLVSIILNITRLNEDSINTSLLYGVLFFQI